MNLKEIIQSGNGKIVDVRSSDEFASGHIRGSINIPLQEVMQHVDELRNMKRSILLVCASGNRSGMAAMMLQREGLDCHNAGGWYQFDQQLSRVEAL